MQDRFTGDIGDYVKFGLLRTLGHDRRLGVAWYLHPDEGGTGNGQHTAYLDRPDEWRRCDPELFDGLKEIVSAGPRSTGRIERAGLLPGARFAGEPLQSAIGPHAERGLWRRAWFRRASARLADCDIVFADPDNGLCADEKFRPAQRRDWKRMPLIEARGLSDGRPAIFYHHNSRFPGGHRLEIEHWMERLPGCAHALYWRRYSNRTFFIVNLPAALQTPLEDFAASWSHGCELVRRA